MDALDCIETTHGMQSGTLDRIAGTREPRMLDQVTEQLGALWRRKRTGPLS
jgi:hypothetical protein